MILPLPSCQQQHSSSSKQQKPGEASAEQERELLQYGFLPRLPCSGCCCGCGCAAVYSEIWPIHTVRLVENKLMTEKIIVYILACFHCRITALLLLFFSRFHSSQSLSLSLFCVFAVRDHCLLPLPLFKEIAALRDNLCPHTTEQHLA